MACGKLVLNLIKIELKGVGKHLTFVQESLIEDLSDRHHQHPVSTLVRAWREAIAEGMLTEIWLNESLFDVFILRATEQLCSGVTPTTKPEGSKTTIEISRRNRTWAEGRPGSSKTIRFKL